MRLMHNLASLNIFYKTSKVDEAQSKAMSRISSGLKVNSSADDPYALSKSEKMRIQILGLQQAAQNAQDGASFLQTAEGGMDGITQDVQRLKQLIVQSGSAGVTASDKGIIQTEVNQTLKNITYLADNTEFNGIKMLGTQYTGSYNNYDAQTNIKTQVGSDSDEKATIPMFNLSAENLGLADSAGVNCVDVTTHTVDENLQRVSAALDNVLHCRSAYGGIENRLESTYDNNAAISDNIQEAESGIRDADIASEVLEYSKDNVLSQAGIALIAQTNKFPQDILNVLSNVRSK